MNKTKLINDPVYGLIHIRTPLVFDVIGHPLFQRLRRIKQTGLTHLVYPGAQHTRFHHALGAMHLMGLVMSELRAKNTPISDQEEEAALLAVLLHDIGHSPYSHALEHLIIDTDHESIGKLIMQKLEGEFGGSMSLAYDMFTGQYHRPFFHQLISGQLDLDRLDYLSRDSFYTGVAEGVVGHDRIIRMMRVTEDQLVIEEKGIFSIEKFLVARRIMYWQVYLHKAVLAAELMAQAFIRQLRVVLDEDLKACIAPELYFFMKSNIRLVDFNQSEVWDQFLQLDDVSVDYAIKQLQFHPDPVLSFLAKRIIQRQLYKIRWSDQPVSEIEIAEAKRTGRERFGWTKELADQLIWTGSESATMYKQEEEIQVLTKQGTIVPYSDFTGPGALISMDHRHFICYPST